MCLTNKSVVRLGLCLLLVATLAGRPKSKTIELGKDAMGAFSSVKPFALTEKQVQANTLLGGPYRDLMLVGGSRSSKTFTLVRAIVTRALRAPGSRHGIFRLRQNAVRASIWKDTLPKVIRLCFPQFVKAARFMEGPCELYLPTATGEESMVWCSGLDEKQRVEKILGLEFSTMFYNECSQIPYNSIVKGRTRLAQKSRVLGDGGKLSDRYLINRNYYDLNPVGKTHWTHREFIEGVDPTNPLRHLLHPEQYAHMFMNPMDNAANVDPEYIESLKSLPLRDQMRFLLGQYVDEFEGTLWPLEVISRQQILREEVPDLVRVVVAVDPSGARGPEETRSDSIGIVVMGKSKDGRGFVLADLTLREAPEKWARAVEGAYHAFDADLVIGETNYGGDMVRSVIHQVNGRLKYEEVSASRGKEVRAEPISALYAMGLIFHVPGLNELEGEMGAFTTGGYQGERSPNRADAMVWAATYLFPEIKGHGLLDLWKKRADQLKAEEAEKKAKLGQVIVSVPTIPAPELHETLVVAQKRELGTTDAGKAWMKPAGKLGKVAKTTTLAPAPACPKCGNKFLSIFSDTVKCGPCGWSGTIAEARASVTQEVPKDFTKGGAG